MNKAQDRMAAIRRRDQVADEPAPAPAPAPQEKPRVSRQTVDIPYARHLALATWRNDTAQALGVLRVTNQEVLSALVEVLLTDETTARKVRKSIEDARAKRQ